MAAFRFPYCLAESLSVFIRRSGVESLFESQQFQLAHSSNNLSEESMNRWAQNRLIREDSASLSEVMSHSASWVESQQYKHFPFISNSEQGGQLRPTESNKQLLDSASNSYNINKSSSFH
jgi:hypothetical protein